MPFWGLNPWLTEQILINQPTKKPSLLQNWIIFAKSVAKLDQSRVYICMYALNACVLDVCLPVYVWTYR